MSALKLEDAHRRIHMVGVLFTREEKQLYIKFCLSRGIAPATLGRHLLLEAAQKPAP